MIERKVIYLTADGSTADMRPNSFWRGFGYISANNSSRLLLDYRAEHREVYDRLLTYMFDAEKGLGMGHIKLELGADINSTSGTEPSVKRSAEEPADVTRGAGFILAADALKIAPDITLELLSWGVPGYIDHAPDNEKRELRYRWFKETLDAAYEKFGLKFSYIDPNINERAVEKEWIKYFSARLRNETDCPYPYSQIKIVIADEDACFNAAGDMLRDPDLMNAVDVIGIHYISASDENTRRCKDEFGKELWYSEGLAPANVSGLAVNADGSGLGGVNGALDVAGRIVNMYPNGGFTAYEFQPAVAAYYSGVNFFPKQLIRANEPWSGHTEYGSGIYMAQHFARFSRKGWRFVQSACYGDGTARDHVLRDTSDNRLVLCDPASGDYSMIFVNNTPDVRSYDVQLKNLSCAEVKVWETRGPDSGKFDENYLKLRKRIIPREGSYSLTVCPYSIVTATTLDTKPMQLDEPLPDEPLALPYWDDFSYSEYGENFLVSRGFAPRYMTDQGGAFEVVSEAGRNVLMQKITKELRGSEWGFTPDPVTSFGDDRWANYTLCANVRLTSDDGCKAGIGARYLLSACEQSRSGYRLEIGSDATWRLYSMMTVLSEGTLTRFDVKAWHRLSLTCSDAQISCSVDGEELASLAVTDGLLFSGRASLFSSYHNVVFADISVEPAGREGFVQRIDALDSRINCSGNWQKNTMGSFILHNRTSAENDGEANFEVKGIGTAAAIIAQSEGAVISVEADGKLIADRITVRNTVPRAALWHSFDISNAHDLRVTVHEGKLLLDTVETI